MRGTKEYKIAIITPVGTEAYNDLILDSVKDTIPPDFRISVYNLPKVDTINIKSTKFIESRYAIGENTPLVASLAVELEKEGYQGIFVSDFDMCGVEVARELVTIPIVGGFRASAYTAMMLANKFSIVTILPNVVTMQKEHIKRFGIVNNFASIRYINESVSDITSQESQKLVISLMARESYKAVMKDGAEAIILGCTGFAGLAKGIEKKLYSKLKITYENNKVEGFNKPVPVIPPNQAAVSYLVMLVRSELAQSGVTYFLPPSYENDK